MCLHGFTGIHCEVKLDECALKNCSVCVNGTCQCPAGEFTPVIQCIPLGDQSLPARRRPHGLVVIGVCLSVCVRTVFVRKISQERVHGSPPNLVGGSRG